MKFSSYYATLPAHTRASVVRSLLSQALRRAFRELVKKVEKAAREGNGEGQPSADTDYIVVESFDDLVQGEVNGRVPFGTWSSKIRTYLVQ